MNDIGKVFKFLYTILYANDTCVLLNGKDYMKLVTFLNCELDKLSSLHGCMCKQVITKCPENLFMIFHRAKMKTVSPIDITMNNCCLNKTVSSVLV